jgi:hypothetical protein
MSAAELLDDPVELTDERRQIILELAQADGQPWTENQDGSGWNDHMGVVMYGEAADVVEKFAARAKARVVAAVQAADTWDEIKDIVHRSLPRPWTADVVNADGSRTIKVKRACDGCGHDVGDVTPLEMQYAMTTLDMPSVVDEHGCGA